MSGILLGRRPEPEPEPPMSELEALRAFAAAIEAEWAEGGHITRAEVKAALDELAHARTAL